jgi:AraC family transcriptional regulator
MTTVRAITEEPGVQRRTPLLETGLALVEDVASSGHAGSVGAEGFSAEAQLVLPYRGLFIWEVGRDAVVGDPNQALFVTPGEEFRMRHPLPGGYAELIVTPGETLLEELTGGPTRSARLHPLFRLRSRRIDPRLQLARARFLGLIAAGAEPLEAEEHLLPLLRTTLGQEQPTLQPARCTQRLMERAKTYLAAELDRSISLAEIARVVGASPGYLTQLFRAVEGVPLHAYLTQLRLARALVELPHAEDLTALAMELGFSSHSHFSARFRRAFGLTPSAFRRSCRRVQQELPV